MKTALIILMSYGLGSIPFGLLLTKIAGLGDIRQIGSGNIGATNVLRTGNKGLAALTLLLDGGKGAAAVALATWFVPSAAMAAGLAVLLGHLFPVWLKFKGGKGVATAIGILTALAWPVGLGVIASWLIVAKISHRSSLAALVSLGLAPFFCLAMGEIVLAMYAVVIAGIVWVRHAANIRRLLNGTEPKIGSKELSRSTPLA